MWYTTFILIFFYVTVTQTQLDTSTSTEDLVDEYYTLTPTETSQFYPQDAEDAQAILNSNKDKIVIASILPYREKMRRYAINELARLRSSTGITPWIRDSHYPQRDFTPFFHDLCFGMIKSEENVLSNYLHVFLDTKDRTWIVIGMVLTKDMYGMISTYNSLMETSFKHQRKRQKKPFENMMRRWVRHNREPIEPGDLDRNYVSQDAQALKNEQEDGGWHENRDQIELILMKKSIKYSRAVIQEFEKAYGGKPIEDMIMDNIHAHKLDKHLANAYSSLAGIMRLYSNGKDRWAAWILCIAVVHPQEWPKVDQAFKQDHDDDSLSKFIVQMNTSDKVMAEMMAVVVDPTFKPTTFTERPIHDGSSKSVTPPPVSPTTLAT